MGLKKQEDYTGYSNSGIKEAMLDALCNAGNYTHFEIIETLSSQISENQRHYQVILATSTD